MSGTKLLVEVDLEQFCRLSWCTLGDGQMEALARVLAADGNVVLTGPGSAPVLRAAVLAWMFVHGDRVLWASQRPWTATGEAGMVSDLIDGSAALRSGVSKIRRTSGDQQIELRNDARAVFRDWGRARGYSARRLIVGDSDKISPSRARCLMTTLLGQDAGNGQVVWTAPELRGEVLEALRDRDDGPALLEA
jgi:hypothetical protein